jgi:WD40 repeat protein
VIRETTGASGVLTEAEARSPLGPAATKPPTLPNQPYRSLAYYDYADRLLFTGRDADVERFATTLDRPDTRILVLHGESGIGKSSFLRAGVIPYLESACVGFRFLRDADGLVIIQPAKDPVGRLAEGLLEMTLLPLTYTKPTGEPLSIDLRSVLDKALGTKADAATLRAALMADPSRLATLLERLAAPLPHALVLIVDQAEELFTLAKEPGEITSRDQALRLLQHVADVRADVKLIISLRTEYYGRLLHHLRAGRRDLARVRDDLLRDFSRTDLIKAIERPTLKIPLVEGQPAPRDRYGFEYEPGVPGEIADGVLKLRTENQDSVLPLVQVICTRLYDREISDSASDRVVTLDDLKAIGHVKGGLRAFAEDALERSMGLVRWDQDAFKAIYTRLYSQQADGTLSTWPAPRADLEKAWYGSRPFDEVVAAARDVRLLREDNMRIEGEEPQAYVRLGHDALAEVAAAWRAEREKFRLIGGLIACAALAAIFLLGILQIYRINRKLHQTSTALEIARDNAERQERIARARLARSVFDQVDGLWSTWPERGQQLLMDLNNYHLSERDFTWGYYFRLCDRVRVLKWHKVAVSAVAFSPDGKTLASAGGDLGHPGELRLWDIATGRPHEILERHDSAVYAVAFSPDGQTLASAGGGGVFQRNNEVRLWDAATGRPRVILKGHEDRVMTVAFSPDGKTLASGGDDGTVRLWDAASGSPRATLAGHAGEVKAVAFSPDGKTLASGGGVFRKPGEVRLWDPATGSPRATLAGHAGQVRAMAFSPDGETLASAGDDGAVRLWDAASGNPRDTLVYESTLYAVAFSPDGKTLASGHVDDRVRLWDRATGKLREALNGHDGSVLAVAFSPDSRALASGSRDRTVRLWAPVICETHATLKGHKTEVTDLAFSPDGKIIASGGRDQTVRLWDPTTGKLRATLAGHEEAVTDVAFSPDGKTLASGGDDGTVRLWDAASGSPRATLAGHTGEVRAVAFSPDGKTLASGGGVFEEPGEVRLWDPASGSPRATLAGHAGQVRAVAFGPDGKTLASAGDDRAVRLWDPATGSPRAILEGHKDIVYAVAFSPDSRTVASGGMDGTVRLWDATTGEPRAVLTGHESPVSAVAFSPDGRTLASGGRDRMVRLWDARTGEPRAVLKGHESTVIGVEFSPDGKTLASAGGDRTLRLWVAVFPSENHPLPSVLESKGEKGGRGKKGDGDPLCRPRIEGDPSP